MFVVYDCGCGFSFVGFWCFWCVVFVVCDFAVYVFG